MREFIQQKLQNLSEKKYKEFSSALIPGADNLLGVRLPQIRTLAKEIVKDDWERELLNYNDIYFEETMLRGMIIGYGTTKSDNVLQACSYIDTFVPQIHNWSICDSFCTSMKIIQKHRAEFWPYLQKFLYSEKEFEVRVGLILLLDHYVKCDAAGNSISRLRHVDELYFAVSNEISGQYTQEILDVVNRPFTQGYYAKMSAAWLIAELFVTFPQYTLAFLEQTDNKLDTYTYNKALQKICESRTPSDEIKSKIKAYIIKH